MNEPRFDTIEQAIDEAARMLSDRFGEADQRAAVELAVVLYSTQERERFKGREKTTEVPYRA
ncbi:MAG TPA: hypothetical protein VHH36_07185 [Candidatus Thermoplasmatota archaeon]|nr:hypothetical protein [Candidatus Thermoplasmatota archaeon]